MSRALGAALIAVVAVSACTTSAAPAPSPPLDGPAVTSFSVTPGYTTAPALVALEWTAAHSDGADLTCRLDADSDGTPEVVVPHCQGTHSRNVTYDAPGGYQATIEVTDGAATATASRLVAVDPGPTETYDIQLRPVGTFTAAEQAAFDAAAARWESVVVTGITDRSVSVAAGGCLDGADPLTGVVDDLVIDVAIRPIDGVGGILGQAGPCVYWTGDGLVRVGKMEFDSADAAAMMSGGVFDDVVLHEMGHVIGIGTMWNVGRSLLAGPGTSDPTFVGARAVAEWSALGGTGDVPVENTGGPGTADAHWRESVFGTELMTGYLGVGSNPLSAMSIASLADLGMHVDLAQADPYSLAGGAALRALPGDPPLRLDVLRPVPRPG